MDAIFNRFLRFVRFAHYGRNDKGGWEWQGCDNCSGPILIKFLLAKWVCKF